MNQPPPITLDPPAQAPGVGAAEPNGHDDSRHPALPPRQNGKTTTAQVPAGGPFEPCQECGAPMDRLQRYCVNCAARRGDADNPSSQYFAAASRWRRRGGQRRTPPPGNGSRAAAVASSRCCRSRSRSGSWWAAVARFGPNDAALLDALKNQNATASTSAARRLAAIVSQ